MKFTKKIIFFTLLLFQLSSVSAFNDIDNNWYKESIQYLKDTGVVNGFENGNYLPEDHTSRAELLKIILNATGVDIETPEKSCFTDISLSDWYTKYICTGVELGIVKGYDDGTFKPNGKVTILESLAFSTRAFDLDIPTTQEGDAWYIKYQNFTHENNIIPIHSYTVDTLSSRGQVAEIIYRMQQVSDNKKIDYKSEGCSINPTLKSGSYDRKVSGISRNYLLYVPNGMKKNKEMKLLVAFHGRTNSNDMVRDYMQLGGGKYGYKQNDFIVAYPAGMGAGPYSWSQYENVEFFDAIITEISEKLCINRDQVFVVGHSLGSYMSNKISCNRGDVIRAMTGVASAGYNGDCTGPVSSLITHLPKDPLASYASGLGAYKIRSEKNVCSDEQKTTRIGDISSCVQRESCSSGNTTIFCNSYATYGSDQHSWPKEGSDDILDFFRDIDNFSK